MNRRLNDSTGRRSLISLLRYKNLRRKIVDFHQRKSQPNPVDRPGRSPSFYPELADLQNFFEAPSQTRQVGKSTGGRQHPLHVRPKLYPGRHHARRIWW